MKSKLTLVLALFAAACAGSTSSSPTGLVPLSRVVAPSPDPRIGLKAGLQDANSAIWNLRLVSHVQSAEGFAGITNSDLGMVGSNVIQGNYNGFQIWDISNPAAPRLRVGKLCPASQSDVTVYKNLLFVSAEAPSARLDCGTTSPTGAVSKDRIRGVRIFDITNIDNPKYLANVQTCRGSHTHTLLTDPADKENIYIYISGTSSVRPADELAGCIADPNDPNTAYFRIEVIKVPLANPAAAAIVSSPRIFTDPVTGKLGLASPRSHGAPPIPPLTPRSTKGDTIAYNTAIGMQRLGRLTATSTAADSARYNKTADSLRAAGITIPAGRGAGGGRAGRAGGAGAAGAPAAPRATGITQCHDITVYPAVGLAGGACAGMGLLLDISDPAHPVRIDAVADSNFSFWHSATFSNDGSKVLFSDEWGGGGQAYCRSSDPKEWGADAIFTIENRKMKFQGYYKMPAEQTRLENCVAHNGTLIPVPGRDIMVQAFYQGGLTVFDWTDPKHAKEIAYFDRGPNDSTRLVSGGYWSAYWYNGHIIGSEEKRGLDIFELTPSAALTQNEIDAAKLVQLTHFNAQDQPKFVWPADIVVGRAYLDQLRRDRGIADGRAVAIGREIDRAMALSGAERRTALLTLSGDLERDAQSAKDGAKVRLLMQNVRDVANAIR
jgi:hypothetical protein